VRKTFLTIASQTRVVTLDVSRANMPLTYLP
jgi:hypothetical protein